MAFGGQWQYNVPSQWLVDADDDDKDMGDYGLLLQMKMNVVMMAIMQDKVAFRGFGESGVFAAIAKVATMPPIYNIQKMWFKGQDTTIVNKFLEERYKQLLAEMPSEYVAAIREVQIDSYKYHAFNHIAKYARNDMIKFPFAQLPSPSYVQICKQLAEEALVGQKKSD
ncbi:hypothetical protein AK812_SmicGene45606 [Symbiodinium microadriaticum]|uniref:Uncharacterized protein n=1 Tax=Symbiodinium microadriaticum TaxID=2951 RepID=A0A1Q9BVM3_SYMMI|nr:hypothetical protein AK812_SmicGene45606 [Symbiodinium microadriaticum]CAE7949285.1 unnamed protein product [Symbiodinium sp. KB8]